MWRGVVGCVVWRECSEEFITEMPLHYFRAKLCSFHTILPNLTCAYRGLRHCLKGTWKPPHQQRNHHTTTPPHIHTTTPPHHHTTTPPHLHTTTSSHHHTTTHPHHYIITPPHHHTTTPPHHHTTTPPHHHTTTPPQHLIYYESPVHRSFCSSLSPLLHPLLASAASNWKPLHATTRDLCHIPAANNRSLKRWF